MPQPIVEGSGAELLPNSRFSIENFDVPLK